MKFRTMLLLAPFLALLTLLPGTSAAQNPQQVRQALSSCVIVLIMDWDKQEVLGNGSGTIVSRDGFLITNNHVVSDEESGEVSSDGLFPIGVNLKGGDAPPTVRYIAKVINRSTDWDLALLQIVQNADGTPLSKDTVFPFLPLGDSNLIELDDTIRVIGFPGLGGSSVTLTRGVVSGFENEGDTRTLIKTDTEISPGNSGGTALNDKGELVGIPTSIQFNQTGKIGHVRPINIFKSTFNGKDNGQNGQTGQAGQQPKPKQDPKATVTVTGQINAADTGKPITGALIGVLEPGLTYDEWDGSEKGVYAFAQTDSDGTFTLNKRIAPDQGYTVILQAKGYQSTYEDAYILAEKADGDSVEWTFKLAQAR